MKKITLFFSLFAIVNLTMAGDNIRPERIKYINEHKDDAIRDMLKTGVPASITLAQACLESQDGGSLLAKQANNHFGIKCSDWKGPSYIQDDDTKDECFRKYKSSLESYDDHSLFLRTRPRYAFLFQFEMTDYKSWAKGLKKAGYATEPAYAERLIKIIEDNQLHLLDKNTEVQYTASVTTDPDNAIISPSPKKIYVPSVEAVEAFASRKILSVNGVNYVVARKGDTYKSLAQELKLGFWQLPKYNEITNSADVREGQIVFIQPKKKEGSDPVYVAKPGDTIYTISQNTGIKEKYLLKYNNLTEGVRIEPGQQLYLCKIQASKS